VDGGGFNYGAHVAAMMGLKTAAVTRLSKDDQRVVDALVRLGITVYPTYTPHSTDMRLHYPTSDVDQRTLSVTHTAALSRRTRSKPWNPGYFSSTLRSAAR